MKETCTQEGKVVTRRTVRANNAYLLVYERVVSRSDDTEPNESSPMRAVATSGSSLVGESMPGEIRGTFSRTTSFRGLPPFGDEYSDFLMKVAPELPMVDCETTRQSQSRKRLK